MNLFYAPCFTAEDNSVALSQEESKHATKVLRKKTGDLIHLTNGKGLMAQGEISDTAGKTVQVSLIEIHLQTPKPYSLDLYVAPTKMNDRYEWFLEKATEIGLSSVTPIICDQSERKVIKAERYEKVLLSAMKQSLQAYLPLLHPAISLKKCLDQDISGETALNSLDLKNKKLSIFIGPEGDFSLSEIKKAIEKGCKPVSFGNTRLRTETAALYACASVAAQNESE
jgi:16S rRNA (uracil1498-N3)-methyltransferase